MGFEGVSRCRTESELHLSWWRIRQNPPFSLTRENEKAESEMLDTTVELTRRARTAQHATPV